MRRSLLLLVLVLLTGCLGPLGLPAPEVSIEPESPGPDDDLVLVLEEIPTGDGLPSMSFQVDWQRDGDVVPELTDVEVVASSWTSTGETWTATVAVVQGEQVGPTAQASVVIGDGGDDDDDSGDDDDVVDDDDSAPDDDDTASDVPLVTAIEGWNTTAVALGTQQGIVVDEGVVPDGVEVPDAGGASWAQHRFADAWFISGEHLDLVTEVRLLDPDGSCTAAPFTGLALEPGGDTERVLSVDQPGMCSGRFTLVLVSASGDVEHDVYVLRGERGEQGAQGADGDQGAQGPVGFSCWDLNGNGSPDLSTEDTDGSGVVDAWDCHGAAGPAGLPGADGEDGEPGSDGAPGSAGLACWDLDEDGSADTVTEDVNGDGAVDVLDCGPDPDCPEGYVREPSESLFVLCSNPATAPGGEDQVVKVGDFWIDRYEASIWSDPDCTGLQYSGGAFPPTFPDTGNWTAQLFACSVPNVMPARWVTWFQAEQACLSSGKDLCSNQQWQAAASGTWDPGSNDGIGGGGCYTINSTPTPRLTGNAGATPAAVGSCVSSWGAEDMIGNVWEWTGSWSVAGTAGWMTLDGEPTTPWPTPYLGDATFNLDGRSYDGSSWSDGLPAAFTRGGDLDDATGAGAFALSSSHGPSYEAGNIGFRCCRRR